jgi:hypothetical protein
MAAKQIPVIGEAFLGSDPEAVKVLRVTFGSSGFSGTNDVDIDTEAAGVELVSFADSGWVISDVVINVVEVFSVAQLGVGYDSSVDAFFADTVVLGLFASTVAGAWSSKATTISTAVASQLLYEGLAFHVDTNLSQGVWAQSSVGPDSVDNTPWPLDSGDTIVANYDGASTLGTEGHAELYVYYQRLGSAARTA